VVVAAVLAMEPQMVIFDEPTTGQDLAGARAILELGKALHREGRTVIVITHHLHLMPDYAERMVVLGEGRVLLDAPLREAYHQIEILRSSFLVPPQAVLLARALRPPLPLVTPEEMAEALRCAGAEATP
jgi:energy-coupling factor transport system ATP-binding protein